VQALADSVPAAIRTGTTGFCAECSAVGNALNAGAKVEGGTMAAIRIASGKIIQACPACQFIAKELGINLVPKP
jgi:cytidine deaminase